MWSIWTATPPCTTWRTGTFQPGISAADFLRKKEGITILQYINDLKLAAAKQLLTDSELQVREIADRLGFASQGYFGRFFRNKTGLTPNAYREAEKRKKIIMEDNTRYLVRCEEASDWVRHVDEGTQIVNDFYLPQGPFEKNEMSDTIYHAGTKVNYHEHSQGYETFFIARGSVECTIRGKKAVAQTGDIVHLPPYTPHGFVFLEEGTIWRELFQEINMQQGILNKNMILKHYPDLYEDPEFIGMYREANGSFVREKEVQDIAPVVPKSEIPGNPGAGLCLGQALRRRLGAEAEGGPF